jgi:hypothetical protein
MKLKGKARKNKNREILEQQKKRVARFCGIGGTYSALELVIMACAKLELTARGDVHPHASIKWICRKLSELDDKDARAVKVKSCVKTKKDFYSSRAWKILRYQAFEKYGNRCQCCGARPEDDISLHADHIKPKSTHPELALDLNNIQILCPDCNIGKINQWSTDWRDWL